MCHDARGSIELELDFATNQPLIGGFSPETPADRGVSHESVNASPWNVEIRL